MGRSERCLPRFRNSRRSPTRGTAAVQPQKKIRNCLPNEYELYVMVPLAPVSENETLLR